MPEWANESGQKQTERLTGEGDFQKWSADFKQWSKPQAAGAETISLPTLHINDSRLNVYENYSVNSDIAKLYQKHRPAIVRINTMDPKADASFSTSTGSGSIIDASGIIATGYHVVKNATALRVKTADGKVYSATIVDADAAKDQALIKIKSNNPFSQFPTVKLAEDSRTARDGAPLLALGFPRNQDAMHVSQLKADKLVNLSSLKIDGGLLVGEDKNRSIIRSFGPAQNGNSGGPVFDMKTGEQIGIVNMSDKTDTYITPVEDLQKFMAQTKAKYNINSLPVRISEENTLPKYSLPFGTSGFQSLERSLAR